MARLITIFLPFLVSVLPQLVAFLGVGIARAIGFGTVAYLGFSKMFDVLIGKVQGLTSGVPHNAIAMMSLCGVDSAINIYLSAAVAMLALRGAFSSGGYRRTVWRKPGDRSDYNWEA